MDGFDGDGHPKVLLSVPSRIKGLPCGFSPGLCVGNWVGSTRSSAGLRDTPLSPTARSAATGSWLLGLCLASALGDSQQLHGRLAPELVARQSGDTTWRAAAGGQPGTSTLKVKLRQSLGIPVQMSNPENLFSAAPNLGGI